MTEQEAAEFRALREKMGMARKRSAQIMVEQEPTTAADQVPAAAVVVPAAGKTLLDFLFDAAERAWSEWQSKQPAGKKPNTNYWWYFIRCARVHSRMLGMSAEDAARYLKSFFELCVAIVQGAKPAPSEHAKLIAQQFVTRLQRQGEVMNATDLENKVLKVWDGITSTPNESKVTAAVRCVFERGAVDAMQLVPVAGRGNPVTYTNPLSGLSPPERNKMTAACVASLHGLRARYVETVANNGDVRVWFHELCNHREHAKSGNGWQAEDCALPVVPDNARRCFALVLWQLWKHIRKVPDSRFPIGERVTMLLGSRDVGHAMSEHIPVSESTIADWRNWMVNEGVLRLTRQGGKRGNSLVASEYEFDAIGWVLWWSRERLAVVDNSPIDWS